MHKLIVKKCTVACALPDFGCAHYFEHNFLSIFITPKHLKLFAGGSLSGYFANNALEGYRTPVPIKTTQNPLTQKPTRQGGARKALS